MLPLFSSFGFFSESVFENWLVFIYVYDYSPVYTLIHFIVEFWQFKTHQTMSLESFLFISTLTDGCVIVPMRTHFLQTRATCGTIEWPHSPPVLQLLAFTIRLYRFLGQIPFKMRNRQNGMLKHHISYKYNLSLYIFSLFELQSNAQLEVKYRSNKKATLITQSSSKNRLFAFLKLHKHLWF